MVQVCAAVGCALVDVYKRQELLRVEHLKKYFDVKKKNKKLSLKAVDDVSFTLNKGEVLGIVGESGCGKSTLVNTILNLYDPTAGKVYFDGKDVFSDERKNRNAFKKNVQIVFQDLSLIHISRAASKVAMRLAG